MAQRTLRCYVHGRDHDWQAICVDLDLAVQASSKRAAQKALEEAIISYIEDARAEAPEVARQLLARRAPWHVRAKLHLASVLYRLRTRGEKDRELRSPVPSLKCTFAEFLAIIEAHGFVLHRHGASNHRRYRGMVGGTVHMVDMSPHNWNDEIKLGTLQSMIRQSGLSQKLFRK